jgi:hypothetical protein
VLFGLVLMVMLATSLSLLTRVETAVAANTRFTARARENAWLGLTVALGQLQKYAGPDARITACAEGTSAWAMTNPYLTGVWGGSSGPAPATWLVSGSEVPGATASTVELNAPDPSDDAESAGDVFLIGNHSVAADPARPTSAEKARRIKVVKQDLYAPAGMVAGLSAASAPRIGRYAWWIGDQGVKASLALRDRVDEVTYPPWNTPTQRQRLRQQLASTPNYFRSDLSQTSYPKTGFDPVAAGVTLAHVRTDAQLALLPSAAHAMDGFMRAHVHDFTSVARAVLASTRTDAAAGLMRDVSLKPEELGAAFKAYADYASYMEEPGTTVRGAEPAIPEIRDVDSPRRRYRISAPVLSSAADPVPGLAFQVAPVLTEIIIQFSVEFAAGYKVGTKTHVALWNPYTSALIPRDDLFVTVSGLPVVTLFNAAGTSMASVDLQGSLPTTIKDAHTGAMKLDLPFDLEDKADRRSWLPGRMYGWVTKNTHDGVIDGALKFYNKNTGSAGRWYYDSGPLAGGSAGIGVTAPAVPHLTIELKHAHGTLATYTTPGFSAFTIPATASPRAKWFAYAVRLKQPWQGDADRTWLKSFDPHDPELSARAWSGFDPTLDFVPPLNPSVYATSDPETALPECLLYRIQGASAAALSCYNDVPLFELPRMPLLSLGALQHMAARGGRAYFIGNSWAGNANAVFDRYFFSGLPSVPSAAMSDPDLRAGQPLPNWNLEAVDGTDTTDLRAAGEYASRHLLQAGGFNINSTSVAAWRAVLSSVRMPGGVMLPDMETVATRDEIGTQKASGATVEERFDSDDTLGAGLPAPTFWRFSQSAQETYFWKPVAATTADQRQFSTHAFRLGVRGCNAASADCAVDTALTTQRLTTDQLEMLAEQIVRRIKLRKETHGPFRNLEAFLGPEAGENTPSLLEAAIAASDINAAEVSPADTNANGGAGLSSLTLTQADVLTALAPYLRVRSDTFVIRSYGETINPATDEVSGKAWLEATVQRVPETVDPADNIEKPTGAFGRRFKLISFRWLSPCDI